MVDALDEILVRVAVRGGGPSKTRYFEPACVESVGLGFRVKSWAPVACRLSLVPVVCCERLLRFACASVAACDCVPHAQSQV